MAIADSLRVHKEDELARLRIQCDLEQRELSNDASRHLASERGERHDEACREAQGKAYTDREVLALGGASSGQMGAWERGRTVLLDSTRPVEPSSAHPPGRTVFSSADPPCGSVTNSWTTREQRALEAALRNFPQSMQTRERWTAIATAVGSRTPRECVERCRAVAAALRASQPPPLLRLSHDLLLSVLRWLGGRELCITARACKELHLAAHDDFLWLPYADALPGKWKYGMMDRGGEPLWAYTLRVRRGLYGAWIKLQEHRAGSCPYLSEIGTVEHGRFTPFSGRLPYRLPYGAICELVQLHARDEGALNHRVYKSVASFLASYAANTRTHVPEDLHMTIREIYKTCYPGFGAGTGSGAYAPGLQAGGSSTKASTSGALLGKGVATMTKKVQDEEMRKRLETNHEFQCLVVC